MRVINIRAYQQIIKFSHGLQCQHQAGIAQFVRRRQQQSPQLLTLIRNNEENSRQIKMSKEYHPVRYKSL